MRKPFFFASLLILGLVIGQGFTRRSEGKGFEELFDEFDESDDSEDWEPRWPSDGPLGKISREEPHSMNYSADTTVVITTSHLSNAGADGRVFIRLYGSENTSVDIGLPNDLINMVVGELFPTNVFEAGSNQTFDLPEADLIGEIRFVEVFHRPAIFSTHAKWRPLLIVIERRSEDTPCAYIPIDRYLEPMKRYIFANYDTSLPMHDPMDSQRYLELITAKKMYQYEYYDRNLPPRVKNSPFEQMYTNSHLVKMFHSNFVVGAAAKLKIFAPSHKWTSYKDMESIFGFGIPRPKYMKGFRDDVWFGKQRVQGGNPMLIRLINRIPDKLGVTPELVEQSLENYTLSEALAKNKIFMVDLEIMHGMREKLKINMTAPIALFYLNKTDVLLPIAIQLFQNKSDHNPVFTPHDDEHTWLLAKFYYNLAEATHHQAVSHLSHTHYLMEPIIITTYRHLAPAHPVFRILAPHFIHTLPINRLAQMTFGDEAQVDGAMNAGSRGILHLVGLGYKDWNLTKEATIGNLFKDHRVTKDILPYYPYRDDITEVYNILNSYVTKVLSFYYGNEEDLPADKEIRNWRRALANARRVPGLALKGIPGIRNEGFATVDQLIETVTGIIFMATAWHASVNFLMYETIAYPPNYPVFLQGEIPTDKRPRTEEEVLSYMPSKNVALATVLVANSLAARYTNSLGNFEIPKLYHPVAQAAIFDLQFELKELSKKIKERNKSRSPTYEWCDPEGIPNAISV